MRDDVRRPPRVARQAAPAARTGPVGAPPRRAVGSPLAAAVRGATPLAIVAAVAATGAFVPLPGPATGLPLGLLIIIAIELGGFALSRQAERWSWLRVWLVLLACTLTLLPALTIQTALSRVPFTAWANGSAGPVIFASLAAIAVFIGVTLLAGILAADAPEHAGILLAPGLLLVPVVLGTRGELNERAALYALAVAWGVGTLVTAIGWVLPRAAKPLVGLAALGVGFVVAWLLGLGAETPPGRGVIVPLLTSLLLITVVVGAAAVPIVALTVNRFAQTVRMQMMDADAPRLPDSRPDPGPRRDRQARSAPPNRR